jgi:hypothetical protein
VAFVPSIEIQPTKSEKEEFLSFMEDYNNKKERKNGHKKPKQN